MDIKMYLYRFTIRFHDNKFIYNALKPIWSKFVNRERNKKLKNFHKNGLKAIKQLSDVCSKFNVSYWLDFGTLLGAIRENGFIAHDDDIDIGVCFEDREKFQRAISHGGFKLTREFIIKEDNRLIGIEQTYHYKGVLIDIFYYNYLTAHTRILYTFTPITDNYLLQDKAEIKKTEVPYFPTKSYMFKGINVNIPSEPEKYLIFHYGENYMIPDPHYRSSDIVKTIQYIPRDKKLADFKQYKRLYS